MTLNVAGAICTSVSIDTRTIVPGALFAALRGPNHDAHEHVLEAFSKGAAAAVVEREIAGAGPQLIVPDVLGWLQDSARRMRRQWGGRVVGISGSAGKTTTKDACAAVLARAFRTGKTAGNYNNHIGVPLTLLNLAGDAEVAVVELGMNHAGEIAALARIAQPEIGVITNSGSAHIENLGSLDAIAAAKRELIEALPAHGTAVLNADDARVREFAKVHPGHTVFYGFSEAAHVRAERVHYESAGSSFQVADVGSFFCPLPAKGGVMAALAALAVAKTLGMNLKDLQTTIAALEPPKMRLQRLEKDGMVIWDDCYNSNPEAAMMMLDLLAATPARRRIAVLGEMLELGEWSLELHRSVGSYAARCGVTTLIGIRGAAAHLVQAARQEGLAADQTLFFDEPAEAGRFLKSFAHDGDSLLFKGSRGTRVELALEAFLN